MYPDKLIPGLNVNLYGIMIAVGLLACFGVLFYFSKRKGLDSRYTDFIFYDAIFAIVFGFLSAALFQAFYNYLENPEQGFRFGSGITFIGGLIGGVVSFLLIYFAFRKYSHGKLTDILSIAPCCILIAHAFGRLGCLFAGCCHGEYLGKDYVFGGIFMRPSGNVSGYYVPIQLYESLFLFILFGVCSYLVLKKDFKHNLSIYLIFYGIFRFVNEFFRSDRRGQFIGSLSPSQFWSIVMVIAGVGVYFLLNYIYKKRALKGEES
ncbi:MAG: prolipoprotein diacylglyceryl transferase [Clostridia bacterium]|nr:prolipoprotein diacylglyceryl transferase [Clostridia bacterium]